MRPALITTPIPSPSSYNVAENRDIINEDECVNLLFNGRMGRTEALHVLHAAQEFLRGVTNPNRRDTIYDDDARVLIRFLTGLRPDGVYAPPLPDTFLKRNQGQRDEEYTPEKMTRQPTRNISESTARIILKYREERKTIKYIRSKYCWYHPRQDERLR